MAYLPYSQHKESTEEETFVKLPTKIWYCLPMRAACLTIGYINLIYILFEIIISIAIAVVACFDYGFEITVSVIVPIAITVIPYILLTLPWLGINIACIISTHKRRPIYIPLFTKFLTFRYVVTLVIFVFSLILISGVSSSLVMIGVETMLANYYLLIYYWYAADVDNNRKSEAEIPNKPVYLEEIPSLSNSNNNKIYTIA